MVLNGRHSRNVSATAAAAGRIYADCRRPIVKRVLPLLLLLVLTAACASTGNIDPEEPRRVVGTENDVRIDAEVFGERITAASTVAVRYVITNQRTTPIAVADIISASSYDEETRTITIDVGSEVPGNELLPRLITIAPGEKKNFATSAHMRIPVPSGGRPGARSFPAALRIKLNFLGGDLTPFQPLLVMTQKALNDRALADALFTTWVEMNEVVYTNAIPMRWEGPRDERGSAGSPF
jgi:hypothetical protein